LLAPRLNHVLGGAALLFGLLAAWPWLVPLSPPAHRADPTAAPPEAALASLPPLSSYAAIVERPLFAPTRRPAPGAPVATAGPSTEGRYRLIGIVGTAAKRHAFIADGTRRADLSEGDAFDGWTVKEIGADRVVLASPAGETVLKLSRAAPEPAATKP
jgi:general secretion pathway protein N